MIPFIRIPRRGKFIETESSLGVARGWGAGELGVTTNGSGFSFWSDENVLELDVGDGCTTLCIYYKPLNCIL